MHKIKKMIMKLMKICAPMGMRLIPLNPKMIIFLSFHGRGYSDNPKAIYEAMKKDERFADYRFIWVMRKKAMQEVEGAKVVPYLWPQYFLAMARAKYWVSNCKLPDYLHKKKQQVYLQTWHGTPLKRLGHDIIAPEGTTFYRSKMTLQQMRATYDVDVARYNYMISPNAFCTEVFQSAFGIDKERLIETGYPRNDCLSNYDQDELIQIKKKYDIPLEKKVILYAPTWRDNSFVRAGYTFELEVDFARWKKMLGEDYVVIFKPHYLIISKFDMSEVEGFVYQVDAKEDISNLYLISDVLVTDYSSVFFDYASLGRPIYFYMYDLEFYREELRGFYIDVHTELPGKIYEQEEMLLEAICEEVYDYETLTQFNQTFNNKEDGKATMRVLDQVFPR